MKNFVALFATCCLCIFCLADADAQKRRRGKTSKQRSSVQRVEGTPRGIRVLAGDKVKDTKGFQAIPQTWFQAGPQAPKARRRTPRRRP